MVKVKWLDTCLIDHIDVVEMQVYLRIGPELVTVHPPLLSMSGTILFRGLLGMILAMLPEKYWDVIR